MDEENIKAELQGLRKYIQDVKKYYLVDPFFTLNLGLCSIEIYTTKVGDPIDIDPEDNILNHKIVYVYGNQFCKDTYGWKQNGAISVSNLINFIKQARRLNKLKAFL